MRTLLDASARSGRSHSDGNQIHAGRNIAEPSTSSAPACSDRSAAFTFGSRRPSEQ